MHVLQINDVLQCLHAVLVSAHDEVGLEVAHEGRDDEEGGRHPEQPQDADGQLVRLVLVVVTTPLWVIHVVFLEYDAIGR